MNANVVRGTEYEPGGVSGDWRLLPADSLRVTVGKKFGKELDLSWEVVGNTAVTDDGETSAGFGVHNLRATYVPQNGILKDTQFRVGLENAFDKTYTPHLSTRTAPGRNVKFSISRMF